MKRWKKRLVALALAAAACVSFAAPVSAGWKKDSPGWWYETAAGSSLRGVWEKIDGFWYCFDENGYMKTGWESWEGGWYYLTPDYVSRYPAGAMLTDAEIVSGVNEGDVIFTQYISSSGDSYSNMGGGMVVAVG